MLSMAFKKRVNQIIAGTVAAVMTLTMVPDVWMPVYADSVRNEIASADIYSDNQTVDSEDNIISTDTSSAPEGYVPIDSEDIQPYSLMALDSDDVNEKAEKIQVLLIEDTYPWSKDVNSKLLSELGISFKKVKTTDFLSQDLGNYSVIVFADDQRFSTYNNYSTFKDNIEKFAELGGVVVFGACDGGWANGTLSSELPGGVKKYREYAARNYIADNAHPIVTGELSDGIKMTDEMLYGNYCSHVSFIEETLPAGADVILRDSIKNAPTLVEYPYGNGYIIASGLTWEFYRDSVNNYSNRAMDDLFLYALNIGNVDVNMQPPIAVSVKAPQSLTALSTGYTPDPFNVKVHLKNVSEETVSGVQAKIILPGGLRLAGIGSEIIDIGTIGAEEAKDLSWNVKAVPVNGEKVYTYKIVITAENGYEKIVTKTVRVPEIKQTEKIYEYTVFSANQNEDLTLNGWKSNFTGGIYSGRNFVCNLSEFYLNGKADAAGNVIANGWQINIPEKNENIEAVPMPDLEEEILQKAGEYTYYSESPSYIQDTNIINGSIMVSGDVTISGTNFEGDCYIIADRDITYNVNNLNTTGRLVLYSRNGNITVNGTNINIDGIMYAPKGTVSFNANETTVRGRIWGDTVNFSGSVFNITGSDSDLDLIGEVLQRGITKTYTTDGDFSEGTLDGVSLAVPDQLILSESRTAEKIPYEKIFGDSQSGNGIKVTYSADTSVISQNGQAVNISYGLSGFGEIHNEENAIDLIIVVDESGSMSGSRMANAKASAKQVVSQMKSEDRCAVVGFEGRGRVLQTLTADKDAVNKAIDKLRASGGNIISNGLKTAIDLFDDNSRQKYIMLISDGEDSSASAAMAAAAGEKGIRILAMMVGNGSLQMQNIAINSNGIYKNAPTAEDIGKIMSYFASEVFNTAGRNTTFKTTIKDKNAIDLNAVTPAPSNVTEHSDGSVTFEWSFDRISVDETETIALPVTANAEGEFAELITDTVCVYYDKNGKPDVIYGDDVIIPVSKYASRGSWSAVFDSKKSGTEWSGIYWNGIRYGDGNINVKAAVSDDGVTFGEAVPVENYGSLSGLAGRYIKLNVDMIVSSDGKTPELFDITVTSENIPEIDNSEPNVAVYGKAGTKVNVPVTLRGIVSDDCLSDRLSFDWSCSNDNVAFSDKNSLITSAVFSAGGEYEVKLKVSDGEKTAAAMFTVTVSPADKYEDIDPESGEAAAPEISVALPQYADRYQKIPARIENLNNTEISWYSVIFNGNQTVEVSDSGEFTLTMPGRNGAYKVVVRAFDWAGKSDVKEYTITVNTEIPTIEILPSAEKAYTGDEAYFTVNTTLADKIKTVEYTLNGKAVAVTDGKYTLDTSAAGTYTLTAKAVTNSNKTITASASIEVIRSSKPVVDLVFDKENYTEGDDVIVTVVAEDENGIAGIALEYDRKQVQLDENNSYTIRNITAGDHTLVGIAWNEAGVVSTAGYSITILPPQETVITVEALVEKTLIDLGDTARVTVNVNGGDGTEKITVDVNSKTVTSNTNIYEYTPDSVGEYAFNVTVETSSGNRKTVSVSFNVTEEYDPDRDVSAPVVELTLDKDSYFEGDDIIVTVKAEDNVGVTKTEVIVNGSEISPEANGK